MKWDVAIGSANFLFATNQQNQYRRETADFRRQRVDQEREVGEQSLDSGYWLRSQASFHMGAGIASTEPLSVTSDEARFRFNASQGVDVWTPGELKLLNDTTIQQGSASTSIGVIGMSGANPMVMLHEATNLFEIEKIAGTWTNTWYWNNLAAPSLITSHTTDGETYIYCGPAEIGTHAYGVGTTIQYNGATNLNLVRWVKQRLIAADGAALYEITDITPAGAPAVLPAAHYTHPVSGWTWTDVAEGPEAIYASGYAGDTSQIYSIGVTENAGALELGVPTVVVEMPRGETVKSLYAYLGSYLIVGTTSGVRVAQIRQGGSLVLGPLLIEDVEVSDAVADGRYVWLTVGGTGNTNLWRMDLGQPLEGDLRFAVASDLHNTDDATARSVTTASDGTVFFAIDSVGLARNVPTYVSEGWLETGRIQFGTLQPKMWRTATLSRIPDDEYDNEMTANLYTSSEPDGPWSLSCQFDETSTYADKQTSGGIYAPELGQEAYVRLVLTPTVLESPTARSTPVLTGYQVSAIPAPQRSRLIAVPIQLWDFERDRNGTVAGHKGYAWERLEAMEGLESDYPTVTYKDFTTGEQRTVYVERVTFTRMTPPYRGEDNAGGVATVLLRIVG